MDTLKNMSNCNSETPGNHPHGGAANCPEYGPSLTVPPKKTAAVSAHPISVQYEEAEWAVIRKSITTIATSHADNAAYQALQDVSRLTATFEEARVVGGQMVSLLLHAFPVEGVVPRRTADADAAISTEIAASGDMHTLLSAAGYSAIKGNHYVKPGTGEEDRAIDLLIPASGSAFTSQVMGGRGFDAAPGLRLALAAPPIVIGVNVTLTDDSILDFEVRVPPVEHALILKSYATQTRHESKDYTDLYNLLSVGFEYRDEPTHIGGWKIDDRGSGARGDAARILHQIADKARSVREFDAAGISRERFVALVRHMVLEHERKH